MAEQKTWLDRALSVVTDVRAGRRRRRAAPGREHLLPPAFYSVLKIDPRRADPQRRAAPRSKSYSAAGQALLLLAFVPAYGASSPPASTASG